MFFTGWDWIILVLTLFGGLYLYGTWSYGYFKRRGIKNLDPGFPVFGGIWKFITKKVHVSEMLKGIYDGFPDEKYVGNFEFTNKILMLRDLELIKQIGIKDFEHFTDHRKFVDEHADPLFGRTLFSLTGTEWRDMRATLSPAFTSSKMKNMFTLVNECADEMAKHFMIAIKNTNEKKLIDLELRDTFTRYTNDVIASSAFGVSVNSLKEKENTFYLMGKKATTFDMYKISKILGYRMMPALFKLIKITITEAEVMDFFRSLVQGMIKMREDTGSVRPDMIQLLVELKKGHLKHDTDTKDESDAGFATVEESAIGKQLTALKHWTADDLTAQALIFFLAGFDTASTLLCFVGYELALNPDVQKKLQEEIDRFIADLKGEKLTYNNLQNLKYLDMVVSEALRLWPPAIVVDRVCVKPYTFPPPSDTATQSYKMDVGGALWIPIYPLHRDPKYYPDPTKFDPERFSDENKGSIPQYAYLPFGIGPRNCIGSRFALMEVKAVIYHLMLHFNLVRTEKTQVPIKIQKSAVTLVAEDGFWVGLEPRRKDSV